MNNDYLIPMPMGIKLKVAAHGHEGLKVAQARPPCGQHQKKISPPRLCENFGLAPPAHGRAFTHGVIAERVARAVMPADFGRVVVPR